MALQIKSSDFKASRRVIRSAQGEVISKTKTQSQLLAERRKRYDVKIDGKLRYSLSNRARTIKSARQRQGRAIGRDAYASWINPPSPKTGENLKAGIIGISQRAGLVGGEDDILYRKLQNLDENNLAQLYARNDLIFDVAFNYGGAENENPMDQRNPEAKPPIPGKKADLIFLVEQYEKAFGPIPLD